MQTATTVDAGAATAPILVPVNGGWIIAAPATARGRFFTWAPDPNGPGYIKHFGTAEYVAAAHGVVTYTNPVSARRALRVVHRAMLQYRYPGATITQRQRLMGDAPRRGWWAIFPDGGSDLYLGRSLADAVSAGLDAFDPIAL